MTEFGYLSVLLSIILGLAITHLLQGWRDCLFARGRLHNYWPTHVWALILLLVCIQFWWSLFSLRDRHEWTFGEFATLLVHTIVIYLTTALVYPDFLPNEPVDLRVHYFAQRRHFFSLLAADAFSAILQDAVMFGNIPTGPKHIFLLCFTALSLLGVKVANESIHKVALAISTVMFVLFILSLFPHLR